MCLSFITSSNIFYLRNFLPDLIFYVLLLVIVIFHSLDAVKVLNNKIRCQVCNRLRAFNKYRRHLLYHERDGAITSTEVENILFQTRYTRLTSNVRAMSMRHGRVCPIVDHNVACSKHVLDLHTHLRRINVLSSSDPEFKKSIDTANHCESQAIFKNSSSLQPKFDQSVSQISGDHSNPIKVSNIPAVIPNDRCEISNTSIFEYIADNDDDSDTQAVAVYSSNFPKICTKISNSLESTIQTFKKFLSTTLAGSLSDTSIDMNITNISMIINGVGDVELFNPKSINLHMSIESQHGRTPSTLISRVESLMKFVNYIYYHQHDVFPKDFDHPRFCSMINGIKNSLFKNKSKRQNEIMTLSRGKYPGTIDALKQWREKRVSLDVLDIIRSFDKDEALELTEVLYNRIRDFLIV